MNNERYVYGIIPRTVPLPLLRGFAPVRAVTSGEVQALLSEVPDALRDLNRDISRRRLAEMAYIHHNVLQALLTFCTPIPVRFGTIVRDEAALSSTLQRTQASLGHALSLLEGKHEWSLKLYVNEPDLKRHLFPDCGIDESTAGKGTRYMLEKRLERRKANKIQAWKQGMAAQLEGLLALQADGRRLPCRDGETYNAGVLLNYSAREAFLSSVGSVREKVDGLGEIRVSGPWPPYSFTPALDWS